MTPVAAVFVIVVVVGLVDVAVVGCWLLLVCC